MSEKRVRPVRPARDRTHVDRKRQQAKDGVWDDIVEGMLSGFEDDGYEVKYPTKRTPKAVAVVCPDCGGEGIFHREFCIHRR